ncbi:MULTISPECIES: hypothetical protein [Salimicrobium]|uniref:Uncharacterized protein n=3 Tax=Salimicrobium TaxID=351195 RepID=K2HBG5_9BACI|nr:MULTISPECIES: hypothetical protein [Salimicrobium]AKG03877.1 hypothetical protein AAV35_003140 [Salimicrobium jeotgali]EKE32905.1 hypothetical protein MJ3_00355 [Salimicrobium jeotgali]MBM7695101.1 hypothetical protein [Salimicrobium jeotgali]SDX96925.1 hypothetical protein SAMN04488081_1756 [Salimicrobium album]SIS69949.1 hypothetical protein SAMN05421758_10475 [Salimicrobium salexigens]
MNLREFIDTCAVSIDVLIYRLGVQGHYEVFFSEAKKIAEQEYTENPGIEMNTLMSKIHTHYLEMLDASLQKR